MTDLRVDPATVPGWGIDADPENDPTYPMRRIEDQTRGDTWDRPVAQRAGVEILESIEYKHRPAVVGTSSPPSGVSGAIRRLAFQRSESDWWHWLLLMGADRINVVEGVVEDLRHGTVPNIPAEMGLKSAWRHDRAGVIDKTIGLGLFAVSIFVAGSIRKRFAEQDAAAARVAATAPAQFIDASPEPDKINVDTTRPAHLRHARS